MGRERRKVDLWYIFVVSRQMRDCPSGAESYVVKGRQCKIYVVQLVCGPLMLVLLLVFTELQIKVNL